MIDTDHNKREEQTPKWLQTIQLNSWEAELLISALVLYALFQVPEYLDKIALQNFSRDSRMHNLFSLVERAIQLLSWGYILHILVRGIWVASVGMSYVFPGGVDAKNLKFKGNFKKELNNSSSSLVRAVLRLEELSSIIYGISFIFFGTLIGFGSFIFSFLFVLEWITPLMSKYSYVGGVFGILMLFYFFLALIVFIDFITNGLFRKWSWSADWFYYVAKFYRVVTLSFLYRRSLLVLISNIKGWKSYLVPVVILTITAGYVFLNGKQRDNWRENYLLSSKQPTYFSTNYENLRGSGERLMATIQSDIVDQNTLRIFLKDQGIFSTLNAFENSIKEDWETFDSYESSKFLNKWLSVKIDSTSLPDIQWFNAQHPVNYEFGFTAFADISAFDRGPHSLSIAIDTAGMKETTKKRLIEGTFKDLFITNIHFFYDKQ